MSVNATDLANSLSHGWFGDVPPCWTISSVRDALTEKNIRNEGQLRKDYLSLMSGVGVIPYEEKGDLGNKKSDDLSNCKLVEVGDFVINSMNFLIGGFGRSPYQGVCSSVYVVARPDERHFDPRFLMRVFQVGEFQRYVGRLGKGIMALRMAIGWDELKNQPIPRPPLSDQTRIANFLDEKTARIDALIAEKERLVEAVGDLFKARLGTAVVEGLDGQCAHVSAHDKGFDKVRKDWRLVPLKYLVSFGGGMTPSKDNEEFWSGGVPWVSPKDMKRFILDDSEDHVSEAALEATGLKLHPIDSVLVVVRGMILAHTFPVAINAAPVTINQDMKALRANSEISPKYLAWLLRGLQPLMLSLTEESAHGTKVLRTDKWANQSVPVPSRPEQEVLVTAYELWGQDTARLSSHLREHISRLREYRSSLISAAVTGQLNIDAFKARQLEAV